MKLVKTLVEWTLAAASVALIVTTGYLWARSMHTKDQIWFQRVIVNSELGTLNFYKYSKMAPGTLVILSTPISTFNTFEGQFETRGGTVFPIRVLTVPGAPTVIIVNYWFIAVLVVVPWILLGILRRRRWARSRVPAFAING
jgi:hypothetical protein